jgi:hypothetical protein
MESVENCEKGVAAKTQTSEGTRMKGREGHNLQSDYTNRLSPWPVLLGNMYYLKGVKAGMRARRGERGVMGHRLQVVPALMSTKD